VAGFISENFIPVKAHIKEQPQVFERFKTQWTPTLLVLDSSGTERHRFEGFLPAEDFREQLELALAKLAFSENKFQEAEQRYRKFVEQHPASEAAPEALYWAGVSQYKATNDAGALKETAQQFKTKYKESSWAKKASVWAG
jgi:TolA-binding protein